MDHETIAIERTFDHPVADVFAAWADPAIRAAWSPPAPGHVVIYDQAAFSVGGSDRSRCGPAADPDVDVEARYLSIVQDGRIVFSEVISHGGRQLSASLVSASFAGIGGRTRFALTVQIASFAGPGIVDGNRQGWAAALGNLADHLAGAVVQ